MNRETETCERGRNIKCNTSLQKAGRKKRKCDRKEKTVEHGNGVREKLEDEKEEKKRKKEK